VQGCGNGLQLSVLQLLLSHLGRILLYCSGQIRYRPDWRARL